MLLSDAFCMRKYSVILAVQGGHQQECLKSKIHLKVWKIQKKSFFLTLQSSSNCFDLCLLNNNIHTEVCSKLPGNHNENLIFFKHISEGGLVEVDLFFFCFFFIWMLQKYPCMRLFIHGFSLLEVCCVLAEGSPWQSSPLMPETNTRSSPDKHEEQLFRCSFTTLSASLSFGRPLCQRLWQRLQQPAAGPTQPLSILRGLSPYIRLSLWCGFYKSGATTGCWCCWLQIKYLRSHPWI